MNARIALAGTLVALLAVAACGGPVDGRAQPAADTTAAAATSGSTSRTGPAGTAGDQPLDSIDPCTLLTKSEAVRLTGVQRKEPGPEQLGSLRGCAFSPEEGSFSVGIRTNVGLAGVQPNGGVVKEIKVGRHEAKELLGPTGSCGIYIGVSEKSRVDVVLNSGNSAVDPCPLATRVAELVEPRLP